MRGFYFFVEEAVFRARAPPPGYPPLGYAPPPGYGAPPGYGHPPPGAVSYYPPPSPGYGPLPPGGYGPPPGGPASLSGVRLVGRLKSFNPKHGFGFIDCPQARAVFGRDVFIHKQQIGCLEVGDEVNFFVAQNKDGMPQSRDVRMTDGSTPGPTPAHLLEQSAGRGRKGSPPAPGTGRRARRKARKKAAAAAAAAVTGGGTSKGDAGASDTVAAEEGPGLGVTSVGRATSEVSLSGPSDDEEGV